MLTNTFLHVRGVGPRIERRIWEQGAHSWDAFLENHREIALASKLKERLRRDLDASRRALDDRDCAFFARRLPPNMFWRLYGTFRNDAAFLDIETTGMGKRDYTTAVGIFDRDGFHSFVHGKNLGDLPEFLGRYRMLVTFNGKCFDLPFLVNEFKDLTLPRAHIDLRFVLAWLGLKGGLKRIEVEMDLPREGILADLDGYAAVLLWQRHLAGDSRALACLIRYNLEDVARLRYLADYAYNKLTSQAEIPVDAIPPQDCPVPDVDFDEEALREILRRRFRGMRGWHDR